MADLSPAQLQFLQQYLAYDSKNYFQKRKLKSDLQDFWRRRDKTRDEIKILPPDHPELARLSGAVTDATRKAETGDLKGAYADLKQIKIDARNAARVVSSGLGRGTVTADLDLLEQKVNQAVPLRQAALDYVAVQGPLLVNRARQIPDPRGGATREAVIEAAGVLAREKARVIADFDEMKREATRLVGLFSAHLSAAPKSDDLFARLNHNIALLNQQSQGQKGKSPLLPVDQSRLITLDRRAKELHLSGSGSELRNEVATLAERHRQEMHTALAAKSVPKLEPSLFTDDQGNQLSPDEVDLKQAEIEDRFRHLEEREAKRLEEAKERYNAYLLGDNVLLAEDPTHPVEDRRPRAFDSSTVTDVLPNGILDRGMDPKALAVLCGTELRDRMAEMLNAPVIVDEVFDMATRSLTDWRNEVAQSVGLAYNPDELDPEDLRRIDAVAEELRAAAVELYPNKATYTDKDDRAPSSFTLNGVNYSDVKKLGQGGGGVVYKATGPNGEQVVLKMTLDQGMSEPTGDDDIGKMRKEAMNHRAASGGEFGDCHENILGMKGTVLDKHGQPMIVMDLADAGDADNYANSMGAASDSGLIPDGARIAMMTTSVRDMVRGLREMQESGMSHHDLKEANIFVTSDGTFKVADFGLAQNLGDRDGEVENLDEFTPGYQPPELLGVGEVGQKADNFTMGEILERMTNPMRDQYQYSERFSSSQSGPRQKETKEGEESSFTSLDRLINGLKNSDPAMRPSLDSVLLSTFMTEVTLSYSEEDVARLKKATAEYARTAGRLTGDLNADKVRIEREIANLEDSKSDALTLKKIKNFERLIEDREDEKDALEIKLLREEDDKKKTKIEEAIADRGKFIDGTRTKIADLQRELNVVRTPTELADINRKIADLRKRLVDTVTRIKSIHEDPKFAPVVKELEEAGKPFA